MPATTSAHVGDNIALTCAVIGEAQASITWKKGTEGHTTGVGSPEYDTDTKITKSVLTFTYLAEADAGDYKCEADFSGTVVTSDVATMAVYCELLL